MESTEDRTILRMSGATIIFKGLADWGGGSGTMAISGSSTSHGSTSSDGKVVTDFYENGVYTMSFANHLVRVTDKGRNLEIDGHNFDLSQARPRIIVETNGVFRVEETSTQPNQPVAEAVAVEIASQPTC